MKQRHVLFDWKVLKLCQNKKGQITNVCWDAFFLILFLDFNKLPAEKKGFKKRASIQTFGTSYFVRAWFWMFELETPQVSSPCRLLCWAFVVNWIWWCHYGVEFALSSFDIPPSQHLQSNAVLSKVILYKSRGEPSLFFAIHIRQNWAGIEL